MTLEKVPFGGQLVQCMYDACGVKMQVGDNLICGERTMGFRVTGHSPGHVIGGKFVPESPLLQLLLNFSDHIRIEHLGHVGGAEQSLKHLRVQGQQLCWYITVPTKPKRIFSANDEGDSVSTSFKAMVPECNPVITSFSAGMS